MESGSLDRLRERLYEKTSNLSVRAKRGLLRESEAESVPIDWKEVERGERRADPLITMKTALVVAAAFLAISFAVAYLLWVSGGNLVSSRNIDIEVQVPSHVSSGDAVSVAVSITNGNNATLELADLVFEFGDGVYGPEGRPLPRARFSIGEIGPGETAEETVTLVFLGEEGEEKVMKTALEYRVAGSNAIFAKSAETTVIVSRAPVGVTIDLPQDANSGDEIEIGITIVSNADSTLPDLFVLVDYPPGFTFKSASPAPARGTDAWEVGDVQALEERRVAIRGTIEGEDFTERALRVRVGNFTPDENFLTFGGSTASLVIKKPSLDLTLRINGIDSREVVVSRAGSVRGELLWSNRLLVPLEDLEFSIQLRGDVFDERSISVANGFYRASDKTLVWSASGFPALREAAPDEEGRATFSFDILDQMPSGKHFSVILDARASGESVTPQVGATRISNRVLKEIKVGSPLQFVSRALYHGGQPAGTGPVPPRVGVETAYTVVWSIGNNTNDFGSVRVKAFLPPYMRWLGGGAADSVSYNEKTGDITWEIGTIPAGAGIIRPTVEVAFQIALAPTPNQIGTAPVILSTQKLEARDTFLGRNLSGSSYDLTTVLSGDPGYQSGEGIVTE